MSSISLYHSGVSGIDIKLGIGNWELGMGELGIARLQLQCELLARELEARTGK